MLPADEPPERIESIPLFICRLLRLLFEEMLPLVLCTLAPSIDETELCRWTLREAPTVTSFPFVLGGLIVDRFAGAISSDDVGVIF